MDEDEMEEYRRQARADLGEHRMTSLPLAGDRIPDWMKKPKLEIEALDEKRQAWHTSLVDLELTPSRNDGIGAGDSHRYGKNYRPDSLQECNYCSEVGHVQEDCARRSAMLAKRKPWAMTGHNSVPPNSGRHKPSSDVLVPRIGASKARHVRYKDSLMHDRNFVSCYPDPELRSRAILEATGTAVSLEEEGEEDEDASSEAISAVEANNDPDTSKPLYGPGKVLKVARKVPVRAKQLPAAGVNRKKMITSSKNVKSGPPLTSPSTSHTLDAKTAAALEEAKAFMASATRGGGTTKGKKERVGATGLPAVQHAKAADPPKRLAGSSRCINTAPLSEVPFWLKRPPKDSMAHLDMSTHPSSSSRLPDHEVVDDQEITALGEAITDKVLLGALQVSGVRIITSDDDDFYDDDDDDDEQSMGAI